MKPSRPSPASSGSMVTKNDFSPADWSTLRNTQLLVGFATVMAGSSGLGTVKEVFALSQGIMESQASDIPLIRDLTNKSEMEAAQTSLKQSLGGVQAKAAGDDLRKRALEQVRSSIACLETHASKEETDAYRRMLYGIAERVANAAREGGFLGFGGTQVSEGERSFLDELRNTLQLDQVRRA
jgi:hypothetical protein